MKPKPSPLNILDLALLEFEYKFIQADEKINIDLKKTFDEYDIDIDFSMNKQEVIQVFIKAAVNMGKNPKPGYSLLAEIGCIFEFNKSIEINDEQKKSIEGYSTIYIAINNLRSIISQLTALSPLGRYILPSVDLNDLIKQKQSQLLKISETTKRTQLKKNASKKVTK